MVLSLPLDEASAKTRTGGPVDEAEDYALDVWAGVVPLSLSAGAPIPDSDGPVPDHVRTYTAAHAPPGPRRTVWYSAARKMTKIAR